MDFEQFARQLGELTNAINDINRKLDDIPLIKSAVLQLLGLSVFNNKINLNSCVQQSAESTTAVQQRAASQLLIALDDVALDSKAQFDTCLDDHIYSEKHDTTYKIPYDNNSASTNGTNDVEVVPSKRPRVNESSTQTRITRTVKEIYESTPEGKNLMYNIHTIFGIGACEEYFNFDKRKTAPIITSYRIANHISILDQLTLRAKVRSISDFDRKIIDYANDATINKNAANENDCSNLILLSSDNPDYQIEYACEVVEQNNHHSFDSEPIATQHCSKETSERPYGRPTRKVKRDKRQKKYNDKWYILKHPKVIECMKSQTFIDDFLNLYFDETNCEIQPHKILRERLRRTPLDRFTLPKRIRRQNFTQAELDIMQKVIAETSYKEAADYFNSTVRSLQCTVRKLEKAHGSNKPANQVVTPINNLDLRLAKKMVEETSLEASAMYFRTTPTGLRRALGHFNKNADGTFAPD